MVEVGDPSSSEASDTRSWSPGDSGESDGRGRLTSRRERGCPITQGDYSNYDEEGSFDSHGEGGSRGSFDDGPCFNHRAYCSERVERRGERPRRGGRVLTNRAGERWDQEREWEAEDHSPTGRRQRGERRRERSCSPLARRSGGEHSRSLLARREPGRCVRSPGARRGRRGGDYSPGSRKGRQSVGGSPTTHKGRGRRTHYSGERSARCCRESTRRSARREMARQSQGAEDFGFDKGFRSEDDRSWDEEVRARDPPQARGHGGEESPTKRTRHERAARGDGAARGPERTGRSGRRSGGSPGPGGVSGVVRQAGHPPAPAPLTGVAGAIATTPLPPACMSDYKLLHLMNTRRNHGKFDARGVRLSHEDREAISRSLPKVMDASAFGKSDCEPWSRWSYQNGVAGKKRDAFCKTAHSPRRDAAEKNGISMRSRARRGKVGGRPIVSSLEQICGTQPTTSDTSLARRRNKEKSKRQIDWVAGWYHAPSPNFCPRSNNGHDSITPVRSECGSRNDMGCRVSTGKKDGTNLQYPSPFCRHALSGIKDGNSAILAEGEAKFSRDREERHGKSGNAEKKRERCSSSVSHSQGRGSIKRKRISNDRARGDCTNLHFGGSGKVRGGRNRDCNSASSSHGHCGKRSCGPYSESSTEWQDFSQSHTGWHDSGQKKAEAKYLREERRVACLKDCSGERCGCKGLCGSPISTKLRRCKRRFLGLLPSPQSSSTGGGDSASSMKETDLSESFVHLHDGSHKMDEDDYHSPHLLSQLHSDQQQKRSTEVNDCTSICCRPVKEVSLSPARPPASDGYGYSASFNDKGHEECLHHCIEHERVMQVDREIYARQHSTNQQTSHSNTELRVFETHNVYLHCYAGNKVAGFGMRKLFNGGDTASAGEGAAVLGSLNSGVVSLHAQYQQRMQQAAVQIQAVVSARNGSNAYTANFQCHHLRQW